MSLPDPVRDHLLDLARIERKLAYACVDASGCLEEAGGQLDHFGLGGLAFGQDLEGRAPYLQGYLQTSKSCVLPSVEVLPGRFAEVRIFPSAPSTWLLLLDSTAATLQRYRMQQRINDLSIQSERALDDRQKDSRRSKQDLFRGEERVLSLLQSNLQGLDLLSERITPERSLRKLRGYVRLMLRTLEAGGGQVVSYQASRIVAIFGLDESPEPGPWRAIQTALSIARAVRSTHPDRERSPELSLRASTGIATGVVRVGPVGTGKWRQIGCLGRPVDRVDALERAARPGEVLMDAESYASAEELRARFTARPDQGTEDTLYSCMT